MTEQEAQAKERLEPEDLTDGGLLAASHLHRYELAARLCAGRRVLDLCCGTGYGSLLLAERGAQSVHGVDVSEEAIAAARAHAGEAATFETADALAYVRAAGAGAHDAVVCFEGLEHVPDPDAVLAELARLAEGGALLVLSFPNSRGFEEDNEFHVTDYGWDQVQAVAGRFPGAVLLGQYLAEGSWIDGTGEDPEAGAEAYLLSGERPQIEWANHWLLIAGAPPEALERARARMALAAAPLDNGYMRALERANAELRRTNARMARKVLGVHDAAAAVMVRRLHEETERAERAAAEAERWHEIADNNDWARAQLERRLAEPRHQVVDRVHDRVERIPGGRRLLATLGRRLSR